MSPPEPPNCRNRGATRLEVLADLAEVLGDYKESSLDWIGTSTRAETDLGAAVDKLRRNGPGPYVYSPYARLLGPDKLRQKLDLVKRLCTHRCTRRECQVAGGQVIAESEYGVRGDRRTICHACLGAERELGTFQSPDRYRQEAVEWLRSVIDGGTTERLKLVRRRYPGVMRTARGSEYDSAALLQADITALRAIAATDAQPREGDT
jgi:hypothetical protein